MGKLVDRHNERNELYSLSQTGKPEMALLYGRRRVGKTFLLGNIWQNPFYFLAADTTSETNRKDLLDELTTLDELRSGSKLSDRSLRRVQEKIAISLACRAAIKINTPLSPEKMRWLLDTLLQSENPYTCPHGRPIILRLDIEEILRGFKRI